jgi:hypothetical protein
MRRQKKRGEVPAPLLQLKRKFTQWRNSRTPGQRIPGPLWKSAARLASEHGLSQTATVLGLDYYSLKRHVDQQSAETTSGAAFIELPSAPLLPTSECIIELEDGTGASMRIHLKGTELPDLLELGRSFWIAE